VRLLAHRAEFPSEPTSSERRTDRPRHCDDLPTHGDPLAFRTDFPTGYRPWSIHYGRRPRKTGPRLFTLTSADNEYDIYLVGIDMGDEAIVYRRALDGEKSHFGIHNSAEEALRAYRLVTDRQLIWDDVRLLKALSR
jgi:hypothetical protein